MQLGDATAGERTQRSPLDVALDAFDAALHGLINTIETGGLEHLSAAEKISFWQRFETSRNRLPLIDHALIADAEATDLAGQRCFSSLAMLLTRTLQLSPSEAAARVRAAAALAAPVSTEDEAEPPVLPHLAAVQRAGQVSTEQVQIVARAMQKLTRPDLNPVEVAAVEQQLVGGGSCQARAGGVLGPPVVCGPVGFVEPYGEAAVGGLGAHTDGMRPPDHDHGSVGVVRAAVVAKGRPPN
jgi:hypothetical protein